MQRHEFDLMSFLFGLLFFALGGAWLVAEEAFDPDVTEWLWPIVLLVGGAIVLASTVRRSRRDDADDATMGR